tara:strand:+ start:389 stop:949 length:561 start_codon:yes stop_codon:yes gene_type:complete
MALPTPFTTTSQVLANYSYTEIASGLGFIQFFLTQSENDEYNLFDRATYTNKPSIQNNDTFVFNTSTFNSTRTLKGEALIEFSCHNGASGTTKNLTINSTLEVVKNGVASTVGTFQEVNDSFNSNTFYVRSSKATLTETSIGLGDSLRLTLVLTGHVSYGKIFIDPAVTTSGALGTSKLNVPFKIE